MSWKPRFYVGETITNKELYEEFQCGNMGGMRKSNRRNCLVIICDHTKMYNDKWKNGVLHYTGMGKNGDQVLYGNQNGTLYYSDTNGIKVYLFEVMNPGEYTFRGQVVLADKPYEEQQKGEDGSIRTVWMFPIRVLEECSDEEIAERMSYVDLEKTAITRGKEKVEHKEVTTKQYTRDPYVTEFAKRIANGKCVLCKQSAPFIDKYGKPYLETHHIIWLSQGGADTVDNTVALCPNCHRKMHIINDKSDVKYLQKVAKDNIKRK